MTMCFCAFGDTAKITIKTVENGTQIIESKHPPLCISIYGAGNIITYGSAWIRPDNHPANFDYVPNAVSWDGNCGTLLGGGRCQAHLYGANAPSPFFNGEGTCAVTITPTDGGATVTDAVGMTVEIRSAGIITFEGSCNGKCPEGYIRCTTQSYPGYCCIPCSQIQGELNNLIQQVRSRNHG